MKKLKNEIKRKLSDFKNKSKYLIDAVVDTYIENKSNEFSITEEHLWDVESSTVRFMRDILVRYYAEVKDHFEDREGLNNKIEHLIMLCNMYIKYEEEFEDIPENLHLEIFSKFSEISKNLWW